MERSVTKDKKSLRKNGTFIFLEGLLSLIDCSFHKT